MIRLNRRTLLGALTACALAGMGAGAARAEVGEDGLHKQPWFALTFKDMAEDLAAANAAGKRLAIIFEQRGCIYCKKLHEEVFTDFDGEALSEKEMARRWGVVFTPTVLFMPEEAPAGAAGAAAVAVMPGDFGKGTTRDMFAWVREKGYAGDEHFQKYHARKIAERR
jgi:thioredoxin-related protein